MSILNFFDVLVIVAFVTILWIKDRERRGGLQEHERQEFLALANDVAERNIAATVSTRVVHSSVTIGGFLFAGLFAVLFQDVVKAFISDVVIAMVWAKKDTAFVSFVSIQTL